MKSRVTVALVGILAQACWPGSIEAQFECKDLAADEKVTHSKPGLIFTVDYPESLSWVMDIGPTETKVRSMPPGMIGFLFKQSEEPAIVEQFDRAVADWNQVLKLDYGDAKVTFYGSPNNQAKSAEYLALVPRGTELYSLYVMLETGEIGCDDVDRREDIEAAIQSIKPNPEFGH